MSMLLPVFLTRSPRRRRLLRRAYRSFFRCPVRRVGLSRLLRLVNVAFLARPRLSARPFAVDRPLPLALMQAHLPVRTPPVLTLPPRQTRLRLAHLSVVTLSSATVPLCPGPLLPSCLQCVCLMMRQSRRLSGRARLFHPVRSQNVPVSFALAMPEFAFLSRYPARNRLGSLPTRPLILLSRPRRCLLGLGRPQRSPPHG